MYPNFQPPLPTWSYPSYRSGDVVALFVPCFIDQLYPNVAAATVSLLRQCGVKWEYPTEQTCCGQPAFNSGYWEESLVVARQFEKVFRQYPFIVTPSSACAAMCRVFYQELAPDSAIAEVGKRVYELSEFLAAVVKRTEFSATFPKKVACHIGCHGRRELGIAASARELLQNVKGLQLVDIPDAETCCGFGGTFSVKSAGVSLAMGQKKLANILNSGCEVLATVDMSCAMHFGGIMHRDVALPKVDIFHIAEILCRK